MVLTAARGSRPSSVEGVGRWWYGGDLADFRRQSPEHILGVVAAASGGNIDAIKAAAGAVGASCKACHDNYRAQ